MCDNVHDSTTERCIMHVLLEEAFKIKTLLFKTCTTDYCPYQPCTSIAKKKKSMDKFATKLVVYIWVSIS